MANIYSGLRSFNDYRRAEEEFQLKKQLQQAQTMKAMQEVNETDIKKLGEGAFLKLGQGLPLTPQEQAAAKFLDAKSGGIQFDPSTGAVVKKPSLFDKIPLPNQDTNQQGMQPVIESPAPSVNINQMEMPKELSPATPSQNIGPYEKEYRRQLAAAAGNPKLQQSIKNSWAKATMEPTDAELKAQGFAERMKESTSKLDIPEVQAAALDPKQRALGAIPLLGNYVVSNDYQSFDQAQRDFINAQLRRESGAVISPSEFANARKQYFPVPGDSNDVLEQKRINRETALNGMIESAGASYEIKQKSSPNKMTRSEEVVNNTNINTSPPKRGESRNGYMFMGGNPNDKNSWKKVK